MTKTITFNELRRIKDSLPDGSTHRIADEMGLMVETVRNYFGGYNFKDGRSCGIHIEPMGVYSRKIKDLKDLKDKATVAIPNDPTNGGRALLLLQSAGLITLEDPKSVTSTPLDIKENKKNLNFKELEAPQLPRSLDDTDISIINTNYAIGARLNPLKDALFIENSDFITTFYSDWCFT